MLLFVRALFAFLVLSLAAAPAVADSWSLPKREIIFSGNKQFRLTIDPRKLSSQLDYFSDKVKEKEPAGQAAFGARTATATLDRRDGKRWTRVWQAPLVNEVAPVSAIVSDDGNYVVTFDNWHSMGYGDDVVVIYDAAGQKLRQYALTDIMPEPLASAAGRSVSSIHWRSDPKFASDGAIAIPLLVSQPGSDGILDESFEVVVLLDPASGNVRPKDSSRWEEAKKIAAERVAAIKRAEAEEKRFFEQPLKAPTADDERGWDAYLREAYFRLDPQWCGGYPSIKVLRRPQASDYAASVKWLEDALHDRDDIGEGAITIGSPDSGNLVREIERIATSVKQNGLSRFTVYVAAPESLRGRIEAALSRSGARLVLLDPSAAIPQRPDRFDGSCDPFADIEAAAEALADEAEGER
jgi:hypothetical protein